VINEPEMLDKARTYIRAVFEEDLVPVVVDPQLAWLLSVFATKLSPKGYENLVEPVVDLLCETVQTIAFINAQLAEEPAYGNMLAALTEEFITQGNV